jgi:hypothetical protein
MRTGWLVVVVVSLTACGGGAPPWSAGQGDSDPGGFVDLRFVDARWDQAGVAVWEQLSLTVSYENTGSAPAGRFDVMVALSADSEISDEEWFCGAATSEPTAAGATADLTLDCEIPRMAPGFYRLGFLLDADDDFAEPDEGDNLALHPDTIELLPYDGQTWEGWESIHYSVVIGEQIHDCTLHWDALGWAVTPCEGCLFSFAIDLLFDEEQSDYDTACSWLAGDQVASWAYVEDHQGHGPYWGYDLGGGFEALAPASFEGGELRYSYGFEVEQGYHGYGYYGSYPGTGVLEGWARVE